MRVTQSILNSTKKNLGLAPEYTAFDPDVIMHINTAFGTLHQLGIGPTEGFMIEDDVPVWSDFLGGNIRYNPVKTYVYLRVRLLFDPPETGHALAAMERQVTEMEWRLSILRESTEWVDPTFGDNARPVLDGGNP